MILRLENIILYITSLFFVVGAIDYLLGNKLKLGSYFEKGINTMGPLALSMAGILSLTPLFSEFLKKILTPISTAIGLDPSVFPCMFIAVDMGGYNIATDISLNSQIGSLSGILISSILGATISFTLPLSLSIVKEKDIKFLAKGILFGIITSPIGLFVAGILLKIDFFILFINLLPVTIFSTFIGIMMIFFPHRCISIFKVFGKIIVFTSIIGLVFQGIYSISEIEILKGLMDLKEVIYIVGKIAIFLGGAYVFLEVIQRVFAKQLIKISTKINITIDTITLLIGSLASNIVVFTNFDKLDDKGKIICSSFAVSGAFVIGGQLGYVASVDNTIIVIYILSKLISGICAVMLSYLTVKMK